MEKHHTTVITIAKKVREYCDRKEKFRIYHGSTNSTRQSKYERDKMVDTSTLCHVLKVDTEKKIVLVEPNVPMDQLVEATLPHGLLPPVVTEFPGITVGGGFSGTAGESSSFRHGYFDQTVNWIEIVLANGEVVTASESENADLFNGAAGSMGTLGVLTLLEIRLIDAKKYVELTYHPPITTPKILEDMWAIAKENSYDYIDAIVFGKENAVLLTARLTDVCEPGRPLQRFSRANDPWFYVHVEKITKNSQTPVIEYVPIVDYLFRYDRGAFWTGAYAFKYFKVPFNRFTRWVLDKYMHTRVMYHALHASGHSDQYIIQDLTLPQHTVSEFIDHVHQSFNIYPLWLCLLPQPDGKLMYPDLCRGDPNPEPSDQPRLVMNVGVWGPGSRKYGTFIEQNRNLERRLRELKGRKWLYAQTYYTEEEFWGIYDRRAYETLREKYHATTLVTVYDKVKTVLDQHPMRTQHAWLNKIWGVWPVSGLYGVYKATLGRDYLLSK